MADGWVKGDITVIQEGFPDFKKAILKSHDRQRRAAEADARKRVAPHRKTGELEDSIFSRSLGPEGWVLGASAEHAWYLEFGTGKYGPTGQPYWIYPVTAGALWWPGAAHPVKRVLHPGIQSDPFLGPALFENTDFWSEIYADEVTEEWVDG